MAFITINGREFPAPDNVWELVVATNVTEGKNAQGEFIGDKVGRDQYKVNNLQWSYLDAEIWAQMCQEFDSFVVTAKSGIWSKRLDHPPDVSGQPERNRRNQYRRPEAHKIQAVQGQYYRLRGD